MNNILGIVITDGVGYRNFILSDFLKIASNKFDKVVIYSGLPQESFDSVLTPKNIEIKELQVYMEGILTWTFRKLKEVAHMYQHKNYYGINNNLVRGYPKKNSKKGVITKIIYKIANIFNSESCINFYEKNQFLSFNNNKISTDYHNLLKIDGPSILFFTHQRPPYVAPFLYAAHKLKIKTSSFVFSWDNLASKGRMMGSFDYYLVWSDLMKSELLYFYPSVESESVKIVGTPQFEPYVIPKYETNKDDFLSKFKLDSIKKIICYSCADVSIGKNDGIVIEAIANAIRNHKIVEEVQLLVRTSPAEDDERFREIRNSFPEIYWNVPKWKLTRENHAESWSQRVPSEEDIKDLRSLLTYVDLNINMCSTMSLDFMLFDKPVINTVFGNETNGLYNDQRFLNYDHYKKVVESGAVAIAKNETELIEAINDSLRYPLKFEQQRKNILDLEISRPIEGTSKRIVETLLELNT